MKFLLMCYSALLRFLVACLRPIVLLLPSEGGRGKLARMFKARRGLVDRIDAFRSAVPGDLWWFHVASAGELEQAIPLMEEVRSRDSECVIFASFFSVSAENGAKTEASRRQARGAAVPWDYADYLCWDTRSQVKRYVGTLDPRHFVTLHAELWPVLFSELEARNVPIWLGAVFFPSVEKLSWARKAYYRRFLAPVTKLATVDERTTHFLQSEFPAKDIQILGDPRIDRVLERASRNTTRTSVGVCELALASVHEDDWSALHEWLETFAKRRHATRLWIVPHELTRDLLRSIEAKLRNLGIPFSRLSLSPEGKANDSQVVLVDQVGHLAELYARVRVAYVGGSFSGAVHNVLEPAAYGVAIVTGPHIHRSCEAVEMQESGALARADSPALLADTLDAMLSNDRYREETGARAARYLKDRQGVGRRYGDWLGDGIVDRTLETGITGTSSRSNETSYSSSTPETL